MSLLIESLFLVAQLQQMSSTHLYGMTLKADDMNGRSHRRRYRSIPNKMLSKSEQCAAHDAVVTIEVVIAETRKSFARLFDSENPSTWEFLAMQSVQMHS